MNGPLQRLRSMSGRAGVIVTIAITTQLFGADQPSPSVSIAPPSTLFSMLRVFGALFLVIALFMGALWLFRNWQSLAARNGKAPRLFVLEARSLGPRHSLYVVGYDHQRFLVSSAPAGINLISMLPDGEVVEQPQPSQAPSAFARVLASALGPITQKGGTK